MSAVASVTINPDLREFLNSLGVKRNARDFDAVRFWQSLTSKNRDHADALATQDDFAAVELVTGKAAVSMAGSVATSTATDQTLLAERRRVAAIHETARRFHLGNDWTQSAIQSNETITTIKARVMDNVAALRGHVSVGPDLNRSSLGPAIEDSLISRLGLPHIQFDKNGLAVLTKGADGRQHPKYVDPHPRAASLQGARLSDLARMWLGSIGIDAETMGAADVCRLAFNPRLRADRFGGALAMHGTSDFDSLLANVANKTLRTAYAEYPVTWPICFRKVTAGDFRTIYRVALGDAPDLSEIKEAGPYKQVSMSEMAESYNLKKYGETFLVSWEAIINDDLGAFTRVPLAGGSAARRLEDATAFAILTSNANMSDSNPLFDSATHANVATGTAIDPPSTSTLNAMRTMMRTQTGPGGGRLNLYPRYMIIPAALEGVSKQLLVSETDPSKSASGITNIWRGTLDLAISPVLDSTSTTGWYVSADPLLIDTIEVCFLESEQQPQVIQGEAFDTDCRQYKIRHCVAAKAIDWRGLCYNAGT